jgi:transposase
MANRLKMAMVHSIHTLLQRGWSQRRIARELGIDRETVGRHARLASASAQAPPGCAAVSGTDVDTGGPSKPARAPPGSELDPTSTYDVVEASKTSHAAVSVEPALDTRHGCAVGDPGAPGFVASQGPEAPPAHPIQLSQCEPFRTIIVAKLEAGLSAKRIHQDLVAEHGFVHQYHSVRRFVQFLRATRPLPFRRMECAPGAEAQIDFGTGAPVIIAADPNQSAAADKTRRRRTHVFRVVLSHSRKAYSEVVYRQTTDDFLRCLENAFHHFGGIPRTLVIDNLKAAVTRTDWYDPDINPKLQAFCQHYGTVLLPTKPYTPRHKGKIERGIGYVKDNALKGRTFTSLAEQNDYLLEWETTVADTRIHGTTRKQVGKLFEDGERAALLPLPIERFACFKEARRRVHRDGHIEVDKAYYSAPPEYVGRTVWARWDGRVVRIFNDRLQQIAIHARHEAGRFSTQSQHIADEKIAGVERGVTQLLRKVRLIGPQSARWAESMLAQRGVPGARVLVGLDALARQYPTPDIEQACEIAQTHGSYHLRVIRELIQRKAPVQEQFAFVEKHPIIRGISEYGAFVRQALWRAPAPPAWSGEEHTLSSSTALESSDPPASFPSSREAHLPDRLSSVYSGEPA